MAFNSKQAKFLGNYIGKSFLVHISQGLYKDIPAIAFVCAATTAIVAPDSRCSRVSPTQAITFRPCKSAYATLSATNCSKRGKKATLSARTQETSACPSITKMQGNCHMFHIIAYVIGFIQ